MRRTVCHSTSSLDKKIAQDPRFKESGYVPSMVANLRALYDSRHKESFIPRAMENSTDEDIIAERLEILVKFKDSLRNKDRREISNTGTMYAEAFTELKDAMNSGDRRVAADIIAQEFVEVVKQQVKSTGKSKLEICKNEFAIFKQVYHNLQNKLDELDEDSSDYDFLDILLENFAPLSVYSRVILKNTESIILGSNASYAANTTEESWEEILYNDIYDVEESTKESWMEMAETKSAFSRVSDYTRHIIAHIAMPGTNIAGYAMRYNPQEVHQHLLNILRGMSNSNRMMSILSFEAENGDAIAKAVLDAINENPLYKRCFFSDLHQGFTPYTEVKSLNGKHSSFSLNSPHAVYFSRYLFNLSTGNVSTNNTVFEIKDGEAVLNINKIKELQKDVDKFKYERNAFQEVITNIFAQQQSTAKNRKQQIVELTNLVVKHANAWGMPATATSITTAMSNAKTRTSILKAFQALYKDGEIINTLTDYEDFNSGKVSASYFVSATATTGKEQIETKTPYAKAIRSILSTLELLEQDKRFPSTARAKSKKNKDTTLHSDNPHSFLTTLLDPIIDMASRGDKAGIKAYIENKYGNNPVFCRIKPNGEREWRHKWLQHLVEGKDEVLDNFSHDKMQQYTSQTGEVKAFEKTSEREKHIIMLQRYAVTEGSNYDSKFAWYPTFVLGDSGASRWIKVPKYDINTIVDGMYKVFLQECLLREQVNNVNSTIKYGSKIKFGNDNETCPLLPFLKYSDKETKSEDQIKEAIRQHYESKVKQNLQKLETEGLITKENDKYIDKVGIAYNRDVNKFITEFTYNSEYASMLQFQLFTISTGFYKDATDLQKRYKEIHASGSTMDVLGKMLTDNGNEEFIFNNIENETAYETAIYFKDIRIDPLENNPDLIKMLELSNPDVVKSYTKDGGSTLTDGQSYRTLDSYRRIAMAFGRWNEKGPEEAVYKLIQKLKTTTDENKRKEIKEEIFKSKVIFQPEKPFLFTHEKVYSATGEQLYIPVQHKCAEVILIPELLPEGSNLQNLGRVMEEQGIDVACSTTVVKVGMFGETDIKGAKDIQSMRDAVTKATKHSLDLSNYFRQQNVPEHVNQARQLGTQAMKMPFVSLDLTGKKKYNYWDRLVDGATIRLTDNTDINPRNGQGVLRFYNSLICANILEDREKFIKKIKDIKGLGARLQQIVISNSRNTIDSLFAYSVTEDDKFLVPIYELGVEYEAMSLLLSWFRKEVNHQLIAGGSAVQASAYGISRMEEDKADDGSLKIVYSNDEHGNLANIQYMEAELSWDLTYTDASGNEVELDYYKYCNEDHTLITNSEGIPLLDIDYPGIRDIVAYRIPTENDYSLMNLKVVKFSPKTVGGVIKVPVEGTTIAGFDYDIDKLYLVRKEFKSQELTKDQVRTVWESLYSNNRDIFRSLLDTRSKVESVEDDIDTLMSVFFSKDGRGKDDAKAIIEGRNTNRKLYEYWEEAGLTEQTGLTYTEFFEDYYNEHKQEFSFEEFDTYNYSKPVKSQSRTARNNEILNILQHRLSDTDTIKDRTTPGGFETAKSVKKEIQDLEGSQETSLSATDPFTWARFSQQAQVAGALIGIFANHNTNNIFSKMAYRMGIKESSAINLNGQKLTNLIAPNRTDGKEINTISTLAELLAASVDAVKDPVLSFLNFNTNTADVACYLARLGYTLEEIGLFLKQPIIVELCEMLENNGRETIDSASKKLIANYSSSMKDVSDMSFAIQRQSTQLSMLKQNIKDYATAKSLGKSAKDEFFNSRGVNQKVILDMFIRAQSAARELSGFISTTKFTAANSVGSTAGDVYNTMYKAHKYTSKDEDAKQLIVQLDSRATKRPNLSTDLDVNDPNYLASILDNPFAFEQCMYDAMKTCFDTIVKEYFPYEIPMYKYNREYLNRVSKNQALTADTINDIHRELFIHALANLEGSIFDPNSFVDGQTLPRKQYYQEQFPRDLRRVLSESKNNKETGEDIEFIENYLDIYDLTNGRTIINARNNMKMTTDAKNDFTAAWERLYQNGEDHIRQLAIDLFLYSYFNSKFKFGGTSLSHLIPNSIKNDIVISHRIEQTSEGIEEKDVTYSDFLNELQSSILGYASNDFVKQYLIDHYNDGQFTAHFYTGSLLKNEPGVAGTGTDTIIIDVAKLSESSPAFRKIVWKSPSTKSNGRYAPIIINRNNVYMLQDTSSSNPDCFTEQSSTVVTYSKIGTLDQKEVLHLLENESIDEDKGTDVQSNPKSASPSDAGVIEAMASQFDNPVEANRILGLDDSGTLTGFIQEVESNPVTGLTKEGIEEEICNGTK